MKRGQSKKRNFLSNQKICLNSYKIRLRVSKTGRLVDRKMLESNPDLGVLYYHITSSSKQLSMNKMGIFLILIFAQLIKQQYLRQLEGLPSQRYSIPIRISNPDTDSVLHYIQNKELLLPHSQKKKTMMYHYVLLINFLSSFCSNFQRLLYHFLFSINFFVNFVI